MEYQATIRLGQATDTADAEGTIISGRPADRLTLAQVEAAAAALTGQIQQVPPRSARSRWRAGGPTSWPAEGAPRCSSRGR